MAPMATSTKSGWVLPFVPPDWLKANLFVIKTPRTFNLDLPVISNAPRDEVAVWPRKVGAGPGGAVPPLRLARR